MKGQYNRQRGQSILEYILLTSFISICCLVAIRELGQVLERRAEQIKSDIVKGVQVGN